MIRLVYVKLPNAKTAEFDATQLSDRDLGLLVDWMRGEWKRADAAP